MALARAWLSRPRLLLMDEPLAALDEPRKDEIFPYLERLRDVAQVPIVYVSHNLAEVARLADEAERIHDRGASWVVGAQWNAYRVGRAARAGRDARHGGAADGRDRAGGTPSAPAAAPRSAGR